MLVRVRVARCFFSVVVVEELAEGDEHTLLLLNFYANTL